MEKVQKINVYINSTNHGICPDCGCRLDYNKNYQKFFCLGKDCSFIADIDGNRIWDNEIRDKNLEEKHKQLKEEVEDYLNTDI